MAGHGPRHNEVHLTRPHLPRCRAPVMVEDNSQLLTDECREELALDIARRIKLDTGNPIEEAALAQNQRTNYVDGRKRS